MVLWLKFFKRTGISYLNCNYSDDHRFIRNTIIKVSAYKHQERMN